MSMRIVRWPRIVFLRWRTSESARARIAFEKAGRPSNVLLVQPSPDEEILCDFCNESIEGELVPLLSSLCRITNALCEDCVLERDANTAPRRSTHGQEEART